MRQGLTIILIGLLLSTTVFARPTPEAFGTLPNIFDAAISPDAKQIAFIANFDGTYVVRVMTLGQSGEKLRGVRLTEGVKPMWVRWVNDSRVFAGFWQSGQYRRVPITSSFIYTLDANTMEGKYLIQPKKVFRQDNSDIIDFLDSDPDHVLMAFSDTNQSIADIQKVDVATGRYRRIKTGRTSIQRWYTDHRGEPRIGQGLVNSSGSKEEWRLTVRDADGKKWRYAKDYPGLQPDVDIFGFTSNPNELIVGDYAGKDTLGLYVYDLIQKQISRELFHHDEYDARGVVFNSESDEVIGARYTADTAEVALFDKYDTLLERMRTRFSEFTVSYVDQSNDGEVLLFKVSNATEPGALMILDSAMDEPQTVAYYRPELPAEKMGEVVSVAYRARDGVRIPAYVTLPPSITTQAALKDLPFVILPHGGPYARKSKNFDYFAQFFATRGYAVLQMNFRGSSGYGKTFEDSGRKNWIVMQDDVTDGARWLIDKGYADPERMCIAGWSYGGYAALMGAIKHPDLYSCAISMAGVTDLKDLINDIRKYRFGRLSANRFVLGGFENKDDIKENSPVRRADELKIPLFLAHGDKDQRVHFDQFKRMKSALRKSSAEVTFVEFEDEDHFLSTQKNRQAFFVKLDAFLTRIMGENEFAE